MKKARDIMSSNLEFVTGEEQVARAAQIMRDADIGLVPVVDDPGSMRLRGVITDRDIAVRCIAEGRDGSCRVSDAMSTDLETVTPDTDAREVMRLMQRQQVRRVPVCEGDRIVGLIAQADVAREIGDDAAVSETVERISEPGGRNRN
jgi:CBS domain-containing protein